MGEKIKLREIKNTGRAFYKSSIILSINQELSKKDRNTLTKRIFEVAEENKEDKFLYVNVMTIEEYYIFKLNVILYGGFTESVNYPSYFEESDINFVLSLFKKFIDSQNLYNPGTVIVIDSYNSFNTTLKIIKDEIILGSWEHK